MKIAETKKVRLSLVGSDGNAYVLIGRFQRAAKAQGWTPEQIRRVTLEMTSGDYNHLLSTLIAHTTERRHDKAKLQDQLS